MPSNNPKPTFNIFGPATRCDIKVGYISTTRGYIDNVGVYAANKYAKLDPGTVFILKTREAIKYLNINEVNELTPNDIIPQTKTCLGPQLNIENPTPHIDFFGGGGVGVQANPVIGSDGSLMAVDVVEGGYGYQYPPHVKARDDLNIGSGTVLTAKLCKKVKTYIVYDKEEDYEEYDFTSCKGVDLTDYGTRYNVYGQPVGSWDPRVYANLSKDPIRAEIHKYQQYLARGLNPWWTTRNNIPLSITSDLGTRRIKYDVKHWGWGGSRTGGVTTGGEPLEFVETEFLVYTQGGHDRGLMFKFTEKSGGHKFTIKADNYGDGAQAESVKIKVKPNSTYNVVSAGSHKKGKGTEQGLITVGSFGGPGKEQDDAGGGPTSTSIFADLVSTRDDDDDLQIQSKSGVFEQGKKGRSSDGKHDTFELTYILQDSNAVTPVTTTAVKTTIDDSFMNNYAISPVPPSNVPGSDNAGILFTFVWEEDFPYDGEYIFRGMRDNEAKMYIDNVYVPNVTNPGNSSSLTNYDAGSGVMGSGGVPAKIKQTMTAGVHQIRVDLFNIPIKENIILQPAGTNDVTFKITTSAQYGNTFKMPQLGIDLKKDFDGPQIDETFIKTLEPGKVYDVIIGSPEAKSKDGGVRLRTQGENVLQCEEASDTDWIDVVCSASQGRFINLPKGSSGGSGENSNNIVYGKLNKSNDPITVTSSGKRIELKDSKGDDTNVSFTIDSGNATFSSDGMSIKGSGKVRINLTYDDNPDYASEAVRTIKIRNVVWTKEKIHKGSETKIVDLGSSRSSGGGGGKEAKCQFVIDGPPPPQIAPPGSTETNGEIQNKNIFNTIDWIGKANRQLWRTNVYGRNGFLGEHGVCPFDTMKLLKDNPYAGTHRIIWNDVEFPFEGNYNIEVEVDDNVNLKFKRAGRVEVDIRKEGFINNKSTSPTGKSTYVRNFKAGTYQIIADLEQIPGGAFGFDIGTGAGTANSNIRAKFGREGNHFYVDVLGTGSATLGFTMISKDRWDVAGVAAKEIRIDNDQGKIKLKRTKNQKKETKTGSGIFTGGKRYRVSIIGAVSGAGPARVSDKKIELLDAHGSDTNVELRLSSISNRVSESVKGINPMALAINVKAAYMVEEVISPRSWQDNPMGLALTIDAPLPPIPQEPIINQDGRCPRNPTWSTRFPGAEKPWWPVTFDRIEDPKWSKFQNRYGLSPVPPLSTLDSDSGGITYTNSWPLVIDYDGFYGVRGTRDNHGAVLIDGKVISTLDGFKAEDPKTTKVYLKKGNYTIGVEVENKETETYALIDRKVFSTKDWIVERTTEPCPIDVTFKVTSAAQFANSMEIVGLFKEAKQFDGPQIDSTHTLPVECDKVYDVIFNSAQSRSEHGGVRLRTSGENVIQMEEHDDADWSDIICSASRGKFFDFGQSSGSDGISSIPIKYTKLNKSNDPITVTSGGKRIELKDSKGDDTNVSFTIDSGKAKFSSDGKSITGSGKVKINLTYDDNPNYASEAVRTISILGVTWTKEKKHKGGETKTVDLGKGGGSGGGGKTNTCKFMVIPKVTGGLTSGTVKDGITYEGPTLATYGGRTGLSPAWDTEYQFRHEFMGREWTSLWKGVNFPTTGKYKIICEADDWLRIYIDDVEIGNPPDFAAEVFEGPREYAFSASKGVHNIRMDYYNIPGNNSSTFETNPVVFAAEIYDKISVTTGHSKSWLNNPIGIAAILLPPPCPRTVEGKGVVCEVEVKDPGTGWTDVYPPIDNEKYPVSLDLVDIVPDVIGINYDCTKDRIVIEPSNGAEAIPVCGGFGQIISTTMITPGIGFTGWPNIRIETETGTNAKLRPVFKIIRDPLDEEIDPNKLIQVTDLVGLKQTGYYDGRPYYGAVFYKDGIRYAGYYETAGQLIPIYDTMQESIDAKITTPPSAIQRSGTDITSNDPRLNIPGTPDNLT